MLSLPARNFCSFKKKSPKFDGLGRGGGFFFKKEKVYENVNENGNNDADVDADTDADADAECTLPNHPSACPPHHPFGSAAGRTPAV